MAYATYQVTGKHTDSALSGQPLILEVNFIEGEGFACTSDHLGSSRAYDVSDSRDAVHMFVREHGFYLVHLREVDPI